MYLSNVEGTNRRGRPLGRWEGKVKEHVSERGVRGNSAVATPLGDASGGSEVSELLID